MALLIGWREWASLPDLGVDRIKVKVDTGAKTSALHAFEIQAHLIDDQEWVEFKVHPLQDNTAVEIACRAPVVAHRTVRDSGGHEETRVVIETEISLGEDSWPIEVTLTDREAMGYRMLLGRKATLNRFYVDPSQSFVVSAPEAQDAEFEEEE